MIKTCAETFAVLVTRLITLSFAEGKFPDKYKFASVTPLLKKEVLTATHSATTTNLQSSDHLQYCEASVYVAAGQQVKKSSNDNRFQSAYRRGHSTETALLRLLNDVYCSADSGFRTMLLQLDLSAAFDTIDTSTLLRRLRHTFGVSGPALNWIASYLVGRKQSVRVGQQQSPNVDC